MLKLNPQQMLLRIAPASGFVDWYVNDFMPQQLPDYHQAIAPDTLSEMVKNGRNQADGYGFKDPVSQVHFVTLMWHIGPNFHQQPGFREIAQNTRQPGPERIDNFYHVSDAHWDHAVQNTDERHWFSEAAE